MPWQKKIEFYKRGGFVFISFRLSNTIAKDTRDFSLGCLLASTGNVATFPLGDAKPLFIFF
jgi:hypothetical protein